MRNTWFRFDDLLVDEGNYTLRLANEEMMQGYFDGSDWYDIKKERRITEEISFIFVNLRDDAIQIKITKSVSIRNQSESR